jgi:hypothetical protein
VIDAPGKPAIISSQLVSPDQPAAEMYRTALASRVAVGTAAVPIITQNKEGKENKEAESEKEERDRNYQIETSRFDWPSLFSASPPAHEDISKPENSEIGDKGVRIVEANSEVHLVVPIASASGKELAALNRTGVKTLNIENEEAHSSGFEAEGEVDMSERRSSCSSSFGDSFDEEEPILESMPTDTTVWESEDEYDAELLTLEELCLDGSSGSSDAGSDLGDNVSKEDKPESSETKLPSYLQNGTGSPSQNSSMTDSTLSEDVTDWEKDSDVETCEQQLYRSTSQTHLIGEKRYQLILFQSTLEPAKKRMVDRLMEEFWIIFNQKWPADAKQCSLASGSSTYITNVSPGSTFRIGTHPGTNLLGSQGGDNGNEQNPDKNPDNGRGEKGKQPESPSNENQTAPGFACPYRKRDPRKYCVRDWRSCALGPHKTVARVK